MTNNRREFLKKFGLAVLAVEILPRKLLAQPAVVSNSLANSRADNDDPEFLPRLTEQDLVINSGLGFLPHRHDLLISKDLLDNPPSDGVRLQTTVNIFHHHDVDLTQAQLQQICRGEHVELRDSTVGEHMFKIYLPVN